MNLNKVIIAGRLTADPELKTTPSGISVCSFSVAVDRRYSKDNKQTGFINIVAWRSTADFITKYFSKGNSICVCGSIQTRNYTDKNGNKRTAVEVVAEEATFCEGKKDNVTATPEAKADTDQSEYEPVEGDDLPF